MKMVSAKCCSHPSVARLHHCVYSVAPRIRWLSCEHTRKPRDGRKRSHVPAEISELLVDALESHG